MRVSIALSENQPGPGTTPLKKIVLKDVPKDVAKAAYKSVIDATYELADLELDPTDKVFTLHGRVKITNPDGSTWFVVSAEWPNVDAAAAAALGDKLDAALKA